MKATGPTRIPNYLRRAKSQEAMLEAALRLFVRKGYGATTVDEIAEATGLTKGAVYFYFGDKAGLLAALIGRAESQIYAPMIHQMKEAGDPIDQIVQYLHWISQKGVVAANLLLLPILISLEFKGKNDAIVGSVSGIYDSLHQALEDTIARGQKSGVIHRKVPPREMAAVVISLTDGALLEFLRRGKRLDGPKFVRALRTTLLSGFLAAPTLKRQRGETAAGRGT
jgi:AcrR family transcriptional regulator